MARNWLRWNEGLEHFPISVVVSALQKVDPAVGYQIDNPMLLSEPP